MDDGGFYYVGRSASSRGMEAASSCPANVGSNPGCDLRPAAIAPPNTPTDPGIDPDARCKRVAWAGIR